MNIANSREYAQQIADLEYTEDSEEKQEFIKLVIRNTLPTYINIPLIEKFKKQASVNVNTRKGLEAGEEE